MERALLPKSLEVEESTGYGLQTVFRTNSQHVTYVNVLSQDENAWQRMSTITTFGTIVANDSRLSSTGGGSMHWLYEFS